MRAIGRHVSRLAGYAPDPLVREWLLLLLFVPHIHPAQGHAICCDNFA
jgi:hypothetical protein